jgi:hypothetical protein
MRRPVAPSVDPFTCLGDRPRRSSVYNYELPGACLPCVRFSDLFSVAQNLKPVVLTTSIIGAKVERCPVNDECRSAPDEQILLESGWGWCGPSLRPFIDYVNPLVALHLTACHYPKLCSLGAIRTPSTKACKVFIPCQSVCPPGQPSLVRLRGPPKRPMARATSRPVRSGRPDFWHKPSSSRGLQPAWAASASGCLRRRSRSSIRRRATTRMIATAAHRLSALSHGSLAAPSPVLIA